MKMAYSAYGRELPLADPPIHLKVAEHVVVALHYNHETMQAILLI